MFFAFAQPRSMALVAMVSSPAIPFDTISFLNPSVPKVKVMETQAYFLEFNNFLQGPWPILLLYLQLFRHMKPSVNVSQTQNKYTSHHFIAPQRHNLNSNSGRLPLPEKDIHLTYKCQTTSKETSTRHYCYNDGAQLRTRRAESVQHYRMWRLQTGGAERKIPL